MNKKMSGEKRYEAVPAESGMKTPAMKAAGLADTCRSGEGGICIRMMKPFGRGIRMLRPDIL